MMGAKRVLPYVGVFVVFVATGWWLTKYALCPGDPRFPLAVPPSDLHFGEVWARDDFLWVLPIRNTTRRTVKVLAIRTSCGCGTIELQQFALRAGQEATLHLKLDLIPRRPEAGCERTFPFLLDIVAALDAGRPLRQRWQLEGVVRQAVQLTPREIDLFGDLVEGGEFPPRSVRVRCFEPATDLELRCDGPLAIVRVERLDPGGGEFELEVAPAADLPVGPFRGVVLVRPGGKQSEVPPFAELRVSGTVLPDVRAIPEAILLGPIPVGRSVIRQVAIRSRSGTVVSVEKAESANESVNVQVVPASDQTPSEIMVSVSVGQPGAQRASVSVQVRREGDTIPRAVAIPIYWYGASKGGVDEA
jgi:hypothetical protein